MVDLHHIMSISNTPEAAYAALTTVEGVRQWWTRDAELEGQVGGCGVFRFYNGTGVTQVAVEELQPPAKVCWRTTASNAPGNWEGTQISFEIRPVAEGVTVSLSHRGFPAQTEELALVNTGWAYYLVSLKQYLETGKGTPQQDKDFAILADSPGNHSAGAAVAITDGEVVLASANLSSSPERVFEALLTSELERWWGSQDSYWMREYQSDLRIGGKWQVNVVRPPGSVFPAGGVFTDLKLPEHASFTRAYEWDFPELGRKATRVTYRVHPRAGGSRLTVTHQGFENCPAAAQEHRIGWERVLNWLVAYLANNSATKKDLPA